MKSWEVADAMRSASELGVGQRSGSVDPVGYLECKVPGCEVTSGELHPIAVFRERTAICNGCEKCCEFTAEEAFEQAGVLIEPRVIVSESEKEDTRRVEAARLFREGAYHRHRPPRGIVPPGHTAALWG